MAAAAAVLLAPAGLLNTVGSATVLDETLLNATIVGLLALGADLSLRASVPNLAVGTLGYASGVYLLDHPDGCSLRAACLATVLVATVAGLAVAVVVVVLRVPGWAASLGLATAAMAWLTREHPGSATTDSWHEPTRLGGYVFAAVALVAAVTGLLGVARPVRDRIGAALAGTDGELRERTASAAVVALVLMTSSGMAGVAGIVSALFSSRTTSTGTGLSLTILAFGAALLGGAAVDGRRWSLFGTVAAAVVLSGVAWSDAAQSNRLSPSMVGAAAILVGLLLGKLGRRGSPQPGRPAPSPQAVPVDLDEEAAGHRAAVPVDLDE